MIGPGSDKNVSQMPSSQHNVCLGCCIHFVSFVFHEFYMYLCVWIIDFIVFVFVYLNPFINCICIFFLIISFAWFVFVVYLLEEQPDTASSGVGVSWVCAGQTHLPFHTNGWSTLSKYNYNYKYKHKYKWKYQYSPTCPSIHMAGLQLVNTVQIQIQIRI